MMADMAKGTPALALIINSPRLWTMCMASARVKTPFTVSAVNSPKECPATKSGFRFTSAEKDFNAA